MMVRRQVLAPPHDGDIEPWDFTDVDRTISGGVSIDGKNWGRWDDTIGIAGVVNGIAPNHQAYLAAGGFGILVGDGAVPNYGLERHWQRAEIRCDSCGGLS
jgi:high affinity Mn2+ porin